MKNVIYIYNTKYTFLYEQTIYVSNDLAIYNDLAESMYSVCVREGVRAKAVSRSLYSFSIVLVGLFIGLFIEGHRAKAYDTLYTYNIYISKHNIYKAHNIYMQYNIPIHLYICTFIYMYIYIYIYICIYVYIL